jgi:hypothetical protein
MYHKICRIIAFVLVIASVLSIGAFAAYNPPDSPDASAYISSYSVSIINGGNGKLKVDFDVTATGVMTKIGATCIKIYTCSGSHIATIWNTDSGRSGMLGSNKIYHSDVETYTVTPGSYYVKVVVYAKNSSGYDSITVTTGCKTIT